MAEEGFETRFREDGKTARSNTKASMLVDARGRAILCARLAADNRGRDIEVLEMNGVVDWVDYLVIVTGSSRRQITTIADEIQDAFEELGEKQLGLEGYERGSWTVLDYADILIHIFNEEKRDYYQLERLWDDAPRIDWQRSRVSSVASVSPEIAVEA